jgi:hypothetical protein
MNSEAEKQTNLREQETTPQTPMPRINPCLLTPAPELDDPDESRAGGDVDFGQLLDQFEQEQATLEEGEVVRGTVVGISERGRRYRLWLQIGRHP